MSSSRECEQSFARSRDAIIADLSLHSSSTYLKRHLYGNARTADLFKGISDEYGQDISKMMENWTTKIGFPLVTVEETETGLKIRQNRFLSTADATVSLLLSLSLSD